MAAPQGGQLRLDFHGSGHSCCVVAESCSGPTTNQLSIYNEDSRPKHRFSRIPDYAFFCFLILFSLISHGGQEQSAAHPNLRLLHLYLLSVHWLASGRAAAVCASAHGIQRHAGRPGHQHPVHCHARQPPLGRAHQRPSGREGLCSLGHGACTASGAMLIVAAALHSIHWLSLAVLVRQPPVSGRGREPWIHRLNAVGHHQRRRRAARPG